jgi:hypothetical protein
MELSRATRWIQTGESHRNRLTRDRREFMTIEVFANADLVGRRAAALIAAETWVLGQTNILLRLGNRSVLS